MGIKDELTAKIIGCCFKVHKELGAGFNEKIYHNALKMQIEIEGLHFVTEKEFEVLYIGKIVGKFRADLIVEDKTIIEIKSLAGNIPKIFESQLISYLKASKIKVGLLVNFGNIRCQIKRLVV